MNYSVQPEWLPRLMSHVEGQANGCWIWKGATQRYGYGCITIAGKSHSVHRLIYEIFVGKIPDGHGVLHSCDRPACCNPEHLHTGTQKDNMVEAATRGRVKAGNDHWSRLRPDWCARGNANGARVHIDKVPRGTGHWRARLTEDDVRSIRAKYATGHVTYTDLECQYHMGRGALWRIVNHTSWKSVQDNPSCE